MWRPALIRSWSLTKTASCPLTVQAAQRFGQQPSEEKKAKATPSQTPPAQTSPVPHRLRLCPNHDRSKLFSGFDPKIPSLARAKAETVLSTDQLVKFTGARGRGRGQHECPWPAKLWDYLGQTARVNDQFLHDRWSRQAKQRPRDFFGHRRHRFSDVQAGPARYGLFCRRRNRSFGK